MQRFDVVYYSTLDSEDIEKSNVSGSEVIEIFNSIPWKTIYSDSINNGVNLFDYSFSVSSVDINQLEFSFDIDFYTDELDSSKVNPNKLRFTLSYSYQEWVTKKRLFGLLSDKQVISDEYIMMNDQDIDFTLKCLQAFVRLNKEYLKSNMYDYFGDEEN